LQDATQTARIAVTIVRPISFLVLEINERSLERGIAQETRFGNKDYNLSGNLVDARIPFNIVLPRVVDNDELIFSVDSNNAVFDAHVLVLNGDYSAINYVTVTVSAKYTPFPSIEVKRTVTLKVFEGVNVENYNDLVRATVAEKDVFLQKSFPHPATAPNRINLKTNIYGNGYTIDGNDATNKSTGTADAENFTMIHIVASGVTISNLNIKSDDPELIKKADGLRGIGVLVGHKDMNNRIVNVTIEYSIVELSLYLLRVYNADIHIKGSIFRNSSNFGIDILSHQSVTRNNRTGEVLSINAQWVSNVIIENVVMAKIVAPAIGISASGNGRSDADNQSSLHVKGFLDIYNWQDLVSGQMLQRELFPGNKAVNDILSGVISNLINDEFAKDTYKDVRYPVQKDDGSTTNYMHLGICAAGGLTPFTGRITFEAGSEAERMYYRFNLDFLTDGSIPALALFRLEPVYFYLYHATDPLLKIDPGSEHVETKELHNQLKNGRTF
jgi:hypothetical protein